MELLAASHEVTDLTHTPVHLGRGGSAAVVAGFGWDADVLGAYAEAVAEDGPDGRLVMLFDDEPGSWTAWECHPAGDEVVICLSGRLTMIQAAGGADRHIELKPGQATDKPRRRVAYRRHPRTGPLPGHHPGGRDGAPAPMT